MSSSSASAEMSDGCFPLGMGVLGVAVGVGMWGWPGALADATVVGRYGLLKEGLIWLWDQGPTVALCLVVAGAAVAVWGAWVLRRNARRTSDEAMGTGGA